MLLYYITDRKSFGGTDAQNLEALLSRVTDAARAGVDWIQLREKDLSARELEHLAHEVVRAVRSNSATTKVLINGRADVAVAVGADGVHLPAGEPSAQEVRAIWSHCKRSPALIGVSAHTSPDVDRAHAEGADFVVFGPVFEKVQTYTPGIGVDALRAAGAQPPNPLSQNALARFPVLALGGIAIANAKACLEAGASGVAGIRLFQHGNLLDTVRRLRELSPLRSV